MASELWKHEPYTQASLSSSIGYAKSLVLSQSSSFQAIEPFSLITEFFYSMLCTPEIWTAGACVRCFEKMYCAALSSDLRPELHFLLVPLSLLKVCVPSSYPARSGNQTQRFCVMVPSCG